jgi:hypothetical protein
MSYFRKRAFNKSNDLTPAIGSKGDDGGWCLVKHRVKKNYPAGYKDLDNYLNTQSLNIDAYGKKKQIEQGAYNIIQFEPTGDEKKYFKNIQLEPHGQMMMDFRGVNLDNVQNALNDFLPLYEAYMLQNYIPNKTGGFTLVKNPVNSTGVVPCSDSSEKRSEDKDCFAYILHNVKYIFAVEDRNPNAVYPYELFNTLLIITAHATYKHRPDKALGCDENIGDLITSFSSNSSSSWGGGGISFAPTQQKKKLARRVARLYMQSKFDQ